MDTYLYDTYRKLGLTPEEIWNLLIESENTNDDIKEEV